MATERKERVARIISDSEKQIAKKIFDAVTSAKIWQTIIQMEADQSKANFGKIDTASTKILFGDALKLYMDANPELKPLRGLAAVHGAKEGAAPKTSPLKIWQTACEVFDTLNSKSSRMSLDGTIQGDSVSLNGIIRATAMKLGANPMEDDWESRIAAVKNALHIRSKTNDGSFKDLGDIRSPILAFTEKGPSDKFAFRKPGWKELISNQTEDDEEEEEADVSFEPAELEKPAEHKTAGKGKKK